MVVFHGLSKRSAAKLFIFHWVTPTIEPMTFGFTIKEVKLVKINLTPNSLSGVVLLWFSFMEIVNYISDLGSIYCCQVPFVIVFCK